MSAKSFATAEHSLLAILPFPEPAELAGVRERFPSLKITWVHQPFGKTHWDTVKSYDESELPFCHFWAYGD